jgi:hypothetical protein
MRVLSRSIIVGVILACALCVGVGGSAARGSVLAGKVTNPANGHDYYLLNQSDWGPAEAQAVAMGGHLATVRNAGENAFIYNTFSGFLPPAIQHRWLWVGLKEIEDESGWLWTSGEPFAYSNWDPTQPDENSGIDEDFVGIALPPLPVGLWHDVQGINNGIDLGWGVVEVVPEPASLAAIALVGWLIASHPRRRRG